MHKHSSGATPLVWVSANIDFVASQGQHQPAGNNEKSLLILTEHSVGAGVDLVFLVPAVLCVCAGFFLEGSESVGRCDRTRRAAVVVLLQRGVFAGVFFLAVSGRKA